MPSYTKNKEEIKDSEEKGEIKYPKFTYFAICLYPEEDESHQQILEYILTNKSMFPRCIYITHDRDIYTEDTIDHKGILHKNGEYKGKHTHVMFKFCKYCRLAGILKHFGHKIYHVEGINNYIVHGHYLLHKTFEAKLEGKPEYELFEVCGDEEFKNDIFIQNTNTAQFMNILQTVKSSNTMFEVFEKYEVENNKEAIEILQKKGYLLLTMQNQYQNFLKGK